LSTTGGVWSQAAELGSEGSAAAAGSGSQSRSLVSCTGNGNSFSSSSFPSVPSSCARRPYGADAGKGKGKGKLELIRQLREESGAPVTEVKKALDVADYDIEKAHVELRKRGIAQAEKKKSKRTAAEGLVAIATDEDSSKVAIVEVNCETDFVCRNDSFQKLAGHAARALLASSKAQEAKSTLGSHSYSVSAEEILALANPAEEEKTVGESLTDVGLGVREKLDIRRGTVVGASSSSGRVGSYLHMSPGPGLGSIGATVSIEVEGKAGSSELLGGVKSQVDAIGRKVAMHIAASNPLYLSEAEIPEDLISAEKDVLRNQPGVSEKPANIVEKMIEGRLGKYFKQVALVKQPFVMDDKVSVEEFLHQQCQQISGVESLSISHFTRFKVGEGIEKKTKSFAEEVAETVQGK
jgi:translation elongation factor Ts